LPSTTASHSHAVRGDTTWDDKQLGPKEIAQREQSFADWKEQGSCRTTTFGLDERGDEVSDGDATERMRAWYYTTIPSFRGRQDRRAAHVRMLRQVCASCPSLLPCRELAKVEPYGFMAGITEDERRPRHKGGVSVFAAESCPSEKEES